MSSQRETVEIIDKLIELTQHNSLSWQAYEPSADMTNGDLRTELTYVTTYLNRKIRIYKQSYKYFMDETSFSWSDRVVFEMIDDNDNSLWEFPQTSNTWDLLNAVQYSNSKVGDFYKDMFSGQ